MQMGRPVRLVSEADSPPVTQLSEGSSAGLHMVLMIGATCNVRPELSPTAMGCLVRLVSEVDSPSVTQLSEGSSAGLHTVQMVGTHCNLRPVISRMALWGSTLTMGPLHSPPGTSLLSQLLHASDKAFVAKQIACSGRARVHVGAGASGALTNSIAMKLGTVAGAHALL